MPSLPGRWIAWSALVLAALAGVAGLAAWRYQRDLGVTGAGLEVRLAAGASARSIARALHAAGLDVGEGEFELAARLTGATRRLRAGRYAIGAGSSLRTVLDQFRRGTVLRERLVIVEGASFRELRSALAASDDLRHDTADWPEQRLLAAVGAAEEHAEGLFAPDTYLFDPGTSDLEVLRQAYRAQQERLRAAWETRAPKLPLGGPYEALIMASLIEKETGSPGDRGRIAAVFLNRRRLRMPLQTDPAVIYGLGARFDGHLHKRDLQADTPYNTYTRGGLPPTPIAAPGVGSIEAACHPEPIRALYFVARGDGSSEFSDTLAAHQRAVDRYVRGARSTTTLPRS